MLLLLLGGGKKLKKASSLSLDWNRDTEKSLAKGRNQLGRTN